ncbi:MAG: CDP-glycerol glycerophosphotransferase family protein [bacterium]|nr:CDP-glycerol glycerophosphotransferase family protein [bacterium]
MIKPEKAKQHIRIAFNFGMEILKTAMLYPVGWLLYRKKNIWLISERGTEARDNGYHFFRYLREKHPEIECYYVIAKDSPDRKRIEALGEAVEYRSLRHYLLLFGARYLVSTHIMGFTPNCGFYNHIQTRIERKVLRGKTVFLQHGITKDNLSYLYQENTKLDLFICGAKPEYEYIAKNWHYQHDEVQYMGFARFDALHEQKIKRQILIMPTWRRWLKYPANAKKTSILDSPYFQSWCGLLKGEKLAALAEKYQVQIIFYPHYEMQEYINQFETVSDKIVLADFAHYDVQQLLKESMLLITDYSSVFFDFAYMEKPVLYYQFDEAEYRARHYAQGYFDYRRDGFGEVATEEDALFDLLEQYLENGCGLKPEYRERIQGFFPLHDQNNCERIYREILDMK